MDQQHPFTPATGHPDTRTGEASLPEAPGTPAPTVLAEGEWLAVSTEGFSEQQRGRPLEHLVKELVQNAMDSVGDSGRIDLDMARAAWIFHTGWERVRPRLAIGSPQAWVKGKAMLQCTKYLPCRSERAHWQPAASIRRCWTFPP